MKPRLARPVMAAVVGSALLAGGAVFGSPAAAAPAPNVTADADSPVELNQPGQETSNPDLEPVAEPAEEPSPPSPVPPTSQPPGSPAPEPPSSPLPEPPGSPLPEPPTSPTAEPPVETPEPTTPAPTPPAPTTPPPAPGDTTAPAGAFKLNSSALWIGQNFTLTQVGVSDNGVKDPAAVSRLVTWGDGSASRLVKGQGAIAKKYAKPGKFTITLTLTDAAGNTSVKKGTATVTKPGVAGVTKKAVWHAELFHVIFKNTPTGTTAIYLNYGDGYSYKLKPRNQSVRSQYWALKSGKLAEPGVFTPKVMYVNKFGNSAVFPIGTVTLRKDSWNPTIKVNKPSKATTRSSWKTITGSVADKGSGGYYATVNIYNWDDTSRPTRCWNGSAWIRYVDTQVYRCNNRVRVVNGKFSLPFKGHKTLRKGYIEISALGIDHALNSGARWYYVSSPLKK